MMQRDIKAIIAAHRMDSQRRELYVEGARDRSFFRWFLRNARNPNAIIHEIDSVKCEGAGEGGCRGRLLKFANDIAKHDVAIRCFADADFDRILGRKISGNVWLTDRRDLEGYFLQLPCIDKILHLALATDRHKPADILQHLSRLGRPLDLLRLLSEREQMKLPFKRTPPDSYLKVSKGIVELKHDAYLQALLQEAKISLKRLDEFKAKLTALSKEFEAIPDEQILHGKDCVCILQAILSSKNFPATSVEPSFWACLEDGLIAGFPNLVAALAYMRVAA